MQSHNEVAEFNLLLVQAYHASLAVDAFDLHSDDPVSVDQFEKLQQAEHQASVALIHYCQSHGQQIIDQL